VLLWLDAVLRGRARFARLGPGSARSATRLRLGGWTIIALAVPALTAAAAVGVPLVTLVRWLWLGGAAAWTADVAAALAQTITYAVGGAVLTTLAAAPLAWLSVRAPGRLSKALEVCHYYVGSLPGVVIALALVSIAVKWMLPLYQTAATVLLAYAILFLPRALVSLRVSMAQAPVELEWAAMALGRSPAAAVRQVTARLAAPGIAASMALVGLGITTELTATLMLAPNGVNTLATEFWAYTSEIDYVAATPYAAMMIVFSLPLTLVLYAQSRKASGA
jgi:iron(III) transport system permease protein